MAKILGLPINEFSLQYMITSAKDHIIYLYIEKLIVAYFSMRCITNNLHHTPRQAPYIVAVQVSERLQFIKYTDKRIKSNTNSLFYITFCVNNLNMHTKYRFQWDL